MCQVVRNFYCLEVNPKYKEQFMFKEANEMFVDGIRNIIDTLFSENILSNGGYLSTSLPELQKLYREGSIVKLVTFASKRKEPRALRLQRYDAWNWQQEYYRQAGP